LPHGENKLVRQDNVVCFDIVNKSFGPYPFAVGELATAHRFIRYAAREATKRKSKKLGEHDTGT